MPNQSDGGSNAKPGKRKTASATVATPFAAGNIDSSFVALPEVPPSNYRCGAGQELASPVSKSREIAGHFMAATQLINPLIERAEKALAALRLGVSASVPMYGDDDGWLVMLSFDKVGNEWVLNQEEGHVDDPDSWKSTRLTTTSRATRLRCLQLLPQLEQALVEKAEADLQEALRTVSDTQVYLAALEARAK